MQNYLKPFLLLSGLVLPCTAVAESASEQLTKIEAETLVLKARERQLDVQAKIITRQSEIASKQAESERSTQIAEPGHPIILSIEGLGKKMFTTLQLDGGTTVDVQPGDMLSNGMKVISIRANEVIIETAKRKRVRLASVSHSPAVFDASFPSAGLRLPPLAPPTAFRGTRR